MSIKCESTLAPVNTSNPWVERNIKFPCLAKNKRGDILLFKRMGQGCIICSDDDDVIGNNNTNIKNMMLYTPLPNGVAVTITQKLP